MATRKVNKVKLPAYSRCRRQSECSAHANGLLEATGHDVDVEHLPRAALDRAMRRQYDAYLLDVGLPEMDGTELARRRRAMPSGRTALMIAITGYGQQFHRRNALGAGFDHYFVKPANPAKLCAAVAEFRKELWLSPSRG